MKLRHHVTVAIPLEVYTPFKKNCQERGVSKTLMLRLLVEAWLKGGMDIQVVKSEPLRQDELPSERGR